jgi:hypothetical protein
MAKTTKKPAGSLEDKARIAAREADRRDAALVAANKLETLADALVAISFFKDAAKIFEDIETVVALVSSVAMRQSKLAGIIVRALDGKSTDSSIDLGLEADNG